MHSILFLSLKVKKQYKESKYFTAGFEDALSYCCGYHKNGVDIWCGNTGTVNGTVVSADSCPDPSKVISWDAVHYTDAANYWIANHIIDGSFSDPPVSISQACSKSINM